MRHLLSTPTHGKKPTPLLTSPLSFHKPKTSAIYFPLSTTSLFNEFSADRSPYGKKVHLCVVCIIDGASAQKGTILRAKYCQSRVLRSTSRAHWQQRPQSQVNLQLGSMFSLLRTRAMRGANCPSASRWSCTSSGGGV